MQKALEDPRNGGTLGRISPEEGAEILARLASGGTLTEPPPIRRRYVRDFLGWLGICVFAIGLALGLAVAVRFM